MTRIRVNGQEEDVAVTTISELLVARGVEPTAQVLAVAVNGSVVRRAQWSSKPLAPGDNIEIVRPFSGG